MKLKLRQKLIRLTHKTLVKKMFHHSFDVENHSWNFSLGATIEEIINDPRHALLLETLAEPAGMTYVLMHKSKKVATYKRLNFTGLTVFEVLQRLVKFYSHKTIRRLLGGADTIFMGLEQKNNQGITSVLINHF